MTSFDERALFSLIDPGFVESYHKLWLTFHTRNLFHINLLMISLHKNICVETRSQNDVFVADSNSA